MDYPIMWLPDDVLEARNDEAIRSYDDREPEWEGEEDD